MGKIRFSTVGLLVALAGVALGVPVSFTGVENNSLLNAANWTGAAVPHNVHVEFGAKGWTPRTTATTSTIGPLHLFSITVNSNVNRVATPGFQIHGGEPGSRISSFNGVTVEAGVSKNVRLSGFWEFNGGVNANPVFQHFGNGILEMNAGQYTQLGLVRSVRFRGSQLNRVSITSFNQNWKGSTILENVDMTIDRASAGSAVNALGSGLLNLSAGSRLSLENYSVLGNSEIRIGDGTVFDVSGSAGGVFTNSSVLQGKGTVVGDIFQTGALRAGPGAGTLTFEDGLTVAETSSVGFELYFGHVDTLANDGGDTLVVAEGSEWMFDGRGAQLEDGIPMAVLSGWGAISGSSTNIMVTDLADGYSLDTSELFTRGVVTANYSASSAGRTSTSQNRPNILWLTSEDNNADWIGCYGNPHAETPNIDRLASQGFQYIHCYANATVCSPSRSTWITGINAISMGTHPMRSRYLIPHDRIKYYPDSLRASGYYTGNDTKTDYNIGGRPDNACWDNPRKVNWRDLVGRQPFFQVINSLQSHESKAQGSVENTEHDPSDTRLRKYHPDLPDIRKNYAKYHDCIKRMDSSIGDSMRKLEEMGLADNTIVIYNSDHGGVMPRSKRYLFSSGLHCPFIIRIPEKYKSLWPADTPGMTVDRLVSFVDMPKTWLSLTQSEIPDTMQGSIFLGEQTEPENETHFAFRGRMDERIDNARAVCDKRFLYVRNYMPYVPWMQHMQYLWKMQATQAWDQLVESGEASEVEARFFSPKGWTEELYDTQKDPDNINNLINDPEAAQVVEQMRKQLRFQQLQFFDSGLLPEAEIVRRAAEHQTTIYELVRNPVLYDLPALLDAADLALEKNPNHRSRLRKLLDSPDVGLRYWGIVGCFLLNDREAGFQALEDPSHEVRAMAAWLLIRTGSKGDAPAFQCLENLLIEKSYATLTVLNIIDWMGDDGEVLIPIVESLKLENYEARLQGLLVNKFK